MAKVKKIGESQPRGVKYVLIVTDSKHAGKMTMFNHM
jgi:hypothetical protein